MYCTYTAPAPQATMRLKQFFPFHLIDSMGTLEETQEAISLELRWEGHWDWQHKARSTTRRRNGSVKQGGGTF